MRRPTVRTSSAVARVRPRLGRRSGDRRRRSPVPPGRLRRLCRDPPPTVPRHRGSRTVAKTQAKKPTARRSSTRSAASRRAPRSAAAFMIVGVCVVDRRRSSSAPPPTSPITDWWEQRQYNDVALADDRRARPSVVPGHHHRRRPTATSDHVPDRQQVDVRGRAAGVRPALERGAAWPRRRSTRKFYTEDDRPELEALVHNLEHGYTILWYDETIADDADDAGRARGRSPRSSTRATPTSGCQVHRRAVDRRRRTARTSPTASTSRSPTGRGGAARPTQAAGRLAVLLGAQRRGARGVHEGVPLPDSPEPDRRLRRQ